jgi:hypothetical protein
MTPWAAASETGTIPGRNSTASYSMTRGTVSACSKLPLPMDEGSAYDPPRRDRNAAYQHVGVDDASTLAFHGIAEDTAMPAARGC